MPDIVAFSYAAVPDADRDDVRAAAERIRIRMKRTAQDIVEIGQDLIAVKAKIGHGNWLPWLEAEFGMSQSSADRFIHVATRFGDKLPTVGNLAPSVVYLLAQNNTPEEVREQIIERAEKGEDVTVDEVKKLKDEVKAEKEKTAAARSEKTNLQDLVTELRGTIDRLRDQRDDARDAVEYQDADEEQLAKLQRAWNGAGTSARERFKEWVAENEPPVMDHRMRA